MSEYQLFFSFSKAYVPAPFIFCPLPLRELKEQTWVKKTRTAEMSITSKYGVPHGKWGRLSLSLLCTHALKFGSPEISFGDRRSDAIRLTGQNPDGGGNQGRFTKSMLQLSTSMLTFENYGEDGMKMENVLIVKRGAFEKKKETPDDRILAPSSYDYNGHITLSDDFYNLVQEHSVPLNWKIYRELQPLEADVYSWMIRRYYGMQQSQVIPWEGIMNQFSDVDLENKSRQQQYAFKKRFKTVMEKIKAEHYGKASFDFVNKGVKLNPSPLSIGKDEVRTIS